MKENVQTVVKHIFDVLKLWSFGHRFIIPLIGECVIVGFCSRECAAATEEDIEGLRRANDTAPNSSTLQVRLL